MADRSDWAAHELDREWNEAEERRELARERLGATNEPRSAPDIFDAHQKLIEHTREAIQILEGGNESLGPRTPCRVCKDLSLYGIHWWCEQVEIERERAAMDQDDGSETDRGLDLGGSPGCAGGCEEDT